MANKIKAVVGAGIAPAFLAASFGLDTTAQWLAFTFGATYGGLWMQHA